MTTRRYTVIMITISLKYKCGFSRHLR